MDSIVLTDSMPAPLINPRNYLVIGSSGRIIEVAVLHGPFNLTMTWHPGCSNTPAVPLPLQMLGVALFTASEQVIMEFPGLFSLFHSHESHPADLSQPLQGLSPCIAFSYLFPHEHLMSISMPE